MTDQRTILLVEDDRALQRALAEALHSAGFTAAQHELRLTGRPA